MTEKSSLFWVVKDCIKTFCSVCMWYVCLSVSTHMICCTCEEDQGQFPLLLSCFRHNLYLILAITHLSLNDPQTSMNFVSASYLTSCLELQTILCGFPLVLQIQVHFLIVSQKHLTYGITSKSSRTFCSHFISHVKVYVLLMWYTKT